MKRHAVKNLKNQNRSVANDISQKKTAGSSGAQHTASRPGTVQLTNLQKTETHEAAPQEKESNAKKYPSYMKDPNPVNPGVNCHGYILGREDAEAPDIIEYYVNNQDKKILIALSGGQIAHSALYENGRVKQKFIGEAPFSLTPGEAIAWLKSKYDSVHHLSPLVLRALSLGEMHEHSSESTDVDFEIHKLSPEARSILEKIIEKKGEKYVGVGIERRSELKNILNRLNSIYQKAEKSGKLGYETLNEHLVHVWAHIEG